MKFRDLDSLSPDDFEHAIADLLLRSGWHEADVTRVNSTFKHGDGGIDIIATRRGIRFAVEAKQRGKGNLVDVKALNQLQTGAKLYGINNRILVTNSYFTSEVKIRALRLGVELIDRDALKSMWEYEASEIGREIKARAYQESIIEECLKTIGTGQRKLLIEMATGLGKTYTVALLTKELLSRGAIKRVLFIAHQIEIITQSVSAFKNVLGVGNYTMSACFAGAAPEQTDFVFATFDTLFNRLRYIDHSEFDLVIVDEAHHAPARTYGAVLDHLKSKYMIGLTATPQRMDGLDVHGFFGGESGHVGRYDLAWALKHKKLAFPRYKVILDNVDQAKLDQLRAGLSVQDIDKSIFLHRKDDGIISKINECVEENKIATPKCIVFCKSIEHMKYMIGYFNPSDVVMIHSKQPDDERRENIRRFRETDLSYVLVVDLFNEGIDIPEANMLVFLRQTSSRTIWLQQLGRGLRKTKNKSIVHVLDFVGSFKQIENVRDLQRAVDRAPIDKDSLKPDAEPNSFDRPQAGDPIHDESILVDFDESAAQVLTLIENLEFRLTTRARIIRQVNHAFSNGIVVTSENIETVLQDVSRDQVATIFGSLLGLARACEPEDYAKIIAKQVEGRIRKSIDEQAIQHSAKYYRLQLSDGVLDIASEIEIDEILSGISPSPSKAVSVGAQSDTTEAQSESPQIDPKAALIAKYSNLLSSVDDYKQLSDEDKKEIKATFKSPFALFKELRIG
ncbi:hypothetical protein BXT89_18165 [Halopseudomonas pachastrellae]|uniref:DEAD/DEAH box helicase family protein n=1 Tax=Halopseudomonas pachastrellae TaxID=254161 RepID=A0A1S8DBQ2_9GAMM|nr:DEAD/DEAH box helicase family protein [Halopseudomonas pachastrellae]ONM42401.1 hypothetical protein BXT89_18165 [Halopseudomonas pachastrellae]SFN03186.1 Superfamily II DNA or RNA helicase [Halopseudomonas pachastrellae]